jgi:hypothetical protein
MNTNNLQNRRRVAMKIFAGFVAFITVMMMVAPFAQY